MDDEEFRMALRYVCLTYLCFGIAVAGYLVIAELLR